MPGPTENRPVFFTVVFQGLELVHASKQKFSTYFVSAAHLTYETNEAQRS